jgi:tRNA (guanine37-N1)-methyltransferase
MADYDMIGDIAIIKGENKTKNKKISQAKALLRKPEVKTVVEKIGNVHGRLRTINVKHILGKRNLIAIHKENNCVFKLNVKSCYFSPRLSGERKLIAEKIKNNQAVLVMFAGVGVYPIVIYKHKKPKKIIGVELGKECCKYFKENLKLNKVPGNRVEVIQGDVKKKVNSKLGKFDVVIMARPNLKESFLEQALLVSKKNTIIYYNGFCKDSEIKGLCEELKKRALKYKRKIKILKVVKAGDIAPYKFRYRIEIKVLN